jgi:hypothetical protein
VLDEGRVVTGIARMAKQPGVDYLLISRDTYNIYASKLTKWHRQRGMRYATCSDVPLFPMSWLADDKLVGFSTELDAKGDLVMAGVRHERHEFLQELIEHLLEEDWGGLIIGQLPTRPG